MPHLPRCSRCGYDLHGLRGSPVCPECGKPAESARARGVWQCVDRRWARWVLDGLDTARVFLLLWSISTGFIGVGVIWLMLDPAGSMAAIVAFYVGLGLWAFAAILGVISCLSAGSPRRAVRRREILQRARVRFFWTPGIGLSVLIIPLMLLGARQWPEAGRLVWTVGLTVLGAALHVVPLWSFNRFTGVLLVALERRPRERRFRRREAAWFAWCLALGSCAFVVAVPLAAGRSLSYAGADTALWTVLATAFLGHSAASLVVLRSVAGVCRALRRISLRASETPTT